MSFPPIIYKEARLLERELRRHGFKATVAGVNTKGEGVRYFVRIGGSRTVDEVRTLADTLARVAGRPACRVKRVKEMVVLEMAPRPRPLFLADVWPAVQELPSGTALLGTNQDGQPVRLRMDSPEVTPLLVSGGQQMGKSAFLRVLALTLAVASSPRRWRLALVPGLHRNSLAALETLPHVWRPSPSTAGTPQQIISIVEALVDAPARSPQVQVLVVVDDVEDVLVATGRAGRAALSWLMTEGPQRGIAPVVVSRRVHKLDSTLVADFVLHAAGRPATNATVPAVLQSIEADLYPRVPGEFVLAGPRTVIPLRVAWAGPQSLDEVVTWYRHRQPVVLVDDEPVDEEPDADLSSDVPMNGDRGNGTVSHERSIPRLEFEDDIPSLS